MVTIVGTGSGALVADGVTKIDIMDPDNDSVIDTAEWGTAPTIVGPNTVGTFNGPGNNGEMWAKIFDNAVNAGGPWGGSTSKTCCSFLPGTSSFTVTSATNQYSLSGYTLANGNDDYGRRPTGWRLFGSNDAFATPGDLLDTVTADLTPGNNNLPWSGNNQVGEVVLPGPTGGYSSFRIVFDENSQAGAATPGVNNPFQLAEVELIGVLADFEIGGDNTIGVYNPPTTIQNVVGGGRFVRVSERPGTDSRFHVSEIEVFGVGVTPDGAGQGSVNGPNLSSNDYVAAGYHIPTTSSSVQHGNPLGVFDGNHESGGAVWSINPGLSAPDPRYTLDLGVETDIALIRAFPRNDTCCQDRFANLQFDVFADDGTGNPGALLDSVNGPDNAPAGTNAMVEVAISGYTSADAVATLNAAVTHIFEIDGLLGTMDLIEIANSNPAVTTYLDLNGATAVIQLINGVPQPGAYQMLAADNILGQFGDIILPENSPFAFDTSQLYQTGLLIILPEPTTLSLLGLGLLAAARRRRR